jgi:hypothetical protein
VPLGVQLGERTDERQQHRTADDVDGHLTLHR